MAQMERNVNLEEIDSDALFGIDALKGQSILQKIIFFTCLGVGIVANVCMPMFIGTPRTVAGVTALTITKWMQMKKFTCTGAGKVLRIHRMEFLKWLDENREGVC